MFSYWAYILVGKNNTGKTTFQRMVVNNLTGRRFKSLRKNRTFSITHRQAPQDLSEIFTANRSFQEVSAYNSVETYFRKYFEEAEICVLSSHADPTCTSDVEQMIKHLKRRCYNVAGVFFHNTYDCVAEDIKELPWTEVMWIYNPPAKSKEKIQLQLSALAADFTQLLLRRSFNQ